MITKKEIKLKLETLEPFRIGGPGEALRGQLNSVALIGGEPVIPGSSLKGALRAELERYLIDTYWDKNTKKWMVGKSILRLVFRLQNYPRMKRG